MNNMNEQKRRRFLEPSNSKNKRLNTINEDPGRKRVEEKRLFVTNQMNRQEKEIKQEDYESLKREKN
jgi:hypothetical protein